MKDLIINNPYRVLGVYSNSPLKERVANQNRLNAFAKVGKEVSFLEDFAGIIPEKPARTTGSITAAITAINLDRDKLRYALFWFVKVSVTDDIVLRYLQIGNLDKAKEILGKKESFAALVNRGTLALLEDDLDTGFSCISNVIHNEGYRKDFFQAIGIANLDIQESEVAELFITELLKEFPAQKLLDAATNGEDKAIIAKKALAEPISIINAAISAAKAVDPKNAKESLLAGTKLMDFTKKALKEVKDIAGETSPQYQVVADNLAKQILQCGINYYNHAPEDDVESPRKAMEFQGYALKIAVGKLIKERCQENCNILKKIIANMPPEEVAVEVRKIEEELREFSKLSFNKIDRAITLLNNTKPLLLTIKEKIGETNSFYLYLSTQVVGKALQNIIAEFNQMKESLETPNPDNASRNVFLSILYDKTKLIISKAWEAMLLMDTFDMELDFKTKHYNPNSKHYGEYARV